MADHLPSAISHQPSAMTGVRSQPSAMTSALSASSIKEHARGLGFDACGIAPAADHPELKFYREWLDRGYAGDMAYLHRTAERRADVRNVLPSARTVIVTA